MWTLTTSQPISSNVYFIQACAHRCFARSVSPSTACLSSVHESSDECAVERDQEHELEKDDEISSELDELIRLQVQTGVIVVDTAVIV